MKKIIYLSILCLGVFLYTEQLYAQHTEIQGILSRARQAARTEVENQARQNLIDSLQFSTEITPRPSAPENKRWQVAIFETLNWYPTEKTLVKLRDQVDRGYLQHASVVLTKDDSSRGMFYFVYRGENGKAIQEQEEIDISYNSDELLNLLLQHFKDTPDVYTGFIVNAHGSGEYMVYGQNYSLFTQTITDKLEKLNLTADIMDLESCHMGSIYSVYPMIKSKKVDYAIVSSDINVGSSDFINFRFITHLQLSPRTAALRAHREMAHLLYGNGEGHSGPNNSLVLYLPGLEQYFETWLNNYYSINDADVEYHLLNKVFRSETDWRSLTNIIFKQRKYVQQNKKSAAVQEFVTSSDKLINELHKAVLSQWCYSAQNEELYFNKIPKDSGCFNGLSTQPKHFKWLIEQYFPHIIL